MRYVISDTHYADPDSWWAGLDEFASKHGGETVVAGDFAHWSFQPLASLQDISPFERVVPGNHDAALIGCELLNYHDEEVLILDEGKQLVTHGHNADPVWNGEGGKWLNAKRRVGRFLLAIGYRWERPGRPDPDKLLRAVKWTHDKLIPRGWHVDKPHRYIDHAEALAREHGADIIIMGHTHRPGVWKRWLADENRELYIVNVGAWVPLNQSWRVHLGSQVGPLMRVEDVPCCVWDLEKRKLLRWDGYDLREMEGR